MRTDPKAYAVNLTPAGAKRLLATSKGNRPVSRKLVVHYADQMSRGMWTLNGEPIIVSKDGAILDGHHRARAVIESGKVVRMMMVEGVDASVFHTIDSGRSRTAGHVLAVSGYKDSNLVGTVCRMLIFWEAGKLVGYFSARGDIVARADILNVASRHTDMEASLHFGERAKKRRVGFPGPVALLHYLCSRLNRDKADEFFELFCTGELISSGDPVYELRERMMRVIDKTAKLDRVASFALFVKAWNAHYAKRRLRSLKWAPAEGFPTIAGEPPLDFAMVARQQP